MGKEGVIMYPLWPSEGKNIKIYMQSRPCIYAHGHTHHIHRGFVNVSIHAKTLVSLPNYSSVSRDLSDISAC